MKEDFKCLSGASLKWIAMTSMFIDHFNKGVILNYIIFNENPPIILDYINDIFAILGRFAFPIFLFLLVEGMIHTKSRGKYILNMLIFGILAEVPYDMFESGQFFDTGGQNMLFTLALAGLTIWLIEMMKEMKFKGWQVAIVLVTLLSGYICSFLGFDYNYYGIFIPVIFYLLKDRRFIATVFSYLVVIKEFWSFSSFILINFYNGERGTINKWIGYAFYPAHLLLIGILRMYVFKF